MHGDSGSLVHAADEIAGMPADVNLRVGIDADRQVVHAIGMQNLDVLEAGAGQFVMQKLVQVADADFG